MLRIFLAFSLLSFAGCAKETKPEPIVATGNPITAADTNLVLTPVEEDEIVLAINLDGQWRKSKEAKATIIIQGKKGRIVANNGGEIDVDVNYLSPTRIRIAETDYNNTYLENWLPREIAKQLNHSPILRAYSILDIVDSDTLRGIFFGWEILHDFKQVQGINSMSAPETWRRIK